LQNFAITGVAGYVAPRHLRAIKETGNLLVAALDPHDSVGILDSYFPEAAYFAEFERFDRYLEKRRRAGEAQRIHYLAICSPNYLHDAHIRLAFRLGAHALCEKPLVINPWNLDALAELEGETGSRVFTVHQLRLHPSVVALSERLRTEGSSRHHEVELTYVTPRGPWYRHSWKGAAERSGGLLANIGIHFFDLLLWLFGRTERSQVHLNEASRASGALDLTRARARWFLSVDATDLPDPSVRRAFRSLSVDGERVEFSEGFENLHTRVYAEMLEGHGCGIEDVRPAIELVHRLRQGALQQDLADAHPLVARRRDERRQRPD
jgi:UDP-N-acetyl-2-amino-2-deoxyglucuronate dehydrogenase